MPDNDTATLEQSPALVASQNSWQCVQAKDKEGWLALMTDDVVIEDPIGPSYTNPDGTGVTGKDGVSQWWEKSVDLATIKITCEETFPSSSPNEIAHILRLRFTFDNGSSTGVRGIFTYKVNDHGLLTNLRGFWNMDMMKPVKEGDGD
ncbi:MAG TPA: nuclear transport factor 2 family protein [Mycobacterium sp.]|jgi:steroid Delta-isomerase|nr:nuclear transport factor 2 family protein [Mycobacterium sp.]